MKLCLQRDRSHRHRHSLYGGHECGGKDISVGPKLLPGTLPVNANGIHSCEPAHRGHRPPAPAVKPGQATSQGQRLHCTRLTDARNRARRSRGTTCSREGAEGLSRMFRLSRGLRHIDRNRAYDVLLPGAPNQRRQTCRYDRKLSRWSARSPPPRFTSTPVRKAPTRRHGPASPSLWLFPIRPGAPATWSAACWHSVCARNWGACSSSKTRRARRPP